MKTLGILVLTVFLSFVAVNPLPAADNWWHAFCKNAGFQPVNGDYCTSAANPLEQWNSLCGSKVSDQSDVDAILGVFSDLGDLNRCACLACMIWKCDNITTPDNDFTLKMDCKSHCLEFARAVEKKTPQGKVLCEIGSNTSTVTVTPKDTVETVVVTVTFPGGGYTGPVGIEPNPSVGQGEQSGTAPDGKSFSATFSYKVGPTWDIPAISYKVTKAPCSAKPVEVVFERPACTISLLIGTGRLLLADQNQSYDLTVKGQGGAGRAKVVVQTPASGPAIEIPVQEPEKGFDLRAHIERFDMGGDASARLEDAKGKIMCSSPRFFVVRKPRVRIGTRCGSDRTIGIKVSDNPDLLPVKITGSIRDKDGTGPNALPEEGLSTEEVEKVWRVRLPGDKKTAGYVFNLRATATIPKIKDVVDTPYDVVIHEWNELCHSITCGDSAVQSTPKSLREPSDEEECEFCNCAYNDENLFLCIPPKCCEALPAVCNGECVKACPEGQKPDPADCTRCITPPPPCVPPACCPEKPSICNGDCYEACPAGYKVDPADCTRCVEDKDTTPPLVAITSPGSGTAVPAGSAIPVTVFFRDDAEGDTGVVSGVFGAAGGALGGGPAPDSFASAPSPTVSQQLVVTAKKDLTGVADRTIVITAEGTDAAGNTGYAAITVVVAEASPPPVTDQCPANFPVVCGGGLCCPSDTRCCGGSNCCPLGSPCCGAGCCAPGMVCCTNQTACCPELSQCCGSACCAAGFKCCGGAGCCPSDTECCGSVCCPAGYRCSGGQCTKI